MRKKLDKVQITKINKITDFTTGEIKVEEIKKVITKGDEPNYVKLYLDTLLTFKSLSKTLNPILMEFLKYMSYASVYDPNGGQVIFVNAEMKRRIAMQTGKTVKRIEQAITEFVKANVFKRIATGTYQVNPSLFGKGDWKDIKSIRATFDFNTGEIITDIDNEIACSLEKQIL